MKQAEHSIALSEMVYEATEAPSTFLKKIDTLHRPEVHSISESALALE
jgi:hypothetical protein